MDILVGRPEYSKLQLEFYHKVISAIHMHPVGCIDLATQEILSEKTQKLILSPFTTLPFCLSFSECTLSVEYTAYNFPVRS